MTEKQIVDKVVHLLGERLEQMVNERLGSAESKPDPQTAPPVEARATAKKASAKKASKKKASSKKAATKKKSATKKK